MKCINLNLREDEGAVPIFRLPQYTVADDQTRRLESFVESFKTATGLANPPEYIIKAPGRINLIGDHIDYHGFSVLPMAIDKSIFIGLARLSDDEQAKVDKEILPQVSGDEEPRLNSSERNTRALTIINIDSVKYPPFQCNHSFKTGCKLDQSHKWYHYILCGYHGVLSRDLLGVEASFIHKHTKSVLTAGDFLQLDADELARLPNIVIFVDSDLPAASGLSSSSALVCAAAIAIKLILANSESYDSGKIKIDSASLAEDCAKFEHLVGTAGGGMDQAVILTAEEGYAKHIDFMPSFKCENIHLPGGRWLVSHSGHECVKAATLGFNTRVLEGKLAAAVIVKKLIVSYFPRTSQLKEIPLDSSITFWRVMRQMQDIRDTTDDFIDFILKSVFHEKRMHAMTLDDICKELDLTREKLISSFKISEEYLANLESGQKIELYKRFMHVLHEAKRVEKFKYVCEFGKGGEVCYMGDLMTESHNSLRHYYECSLSSLDELVEISLKAGAYGARLTGAGWGGCVITLVGNDKLKDVLLELRKRSRFTYEVRPSAGASIIKVPRAAELDSLSRLFAYTSIS